LVLAPTPTPTPFKDFIYPKASIQIASFYQYKTRLDKSFRFILSFNFLRE
jgi:hypothetical protein